jgi:hypothetical protein
MEWAFGDNSWDIYANHKGSWCLYRSKICQEGRCVDCGIYIDSKEKFDTLMAKMLKVED